MRKFYLLLCFWALISAQEVMAQTVTARNTPCDADASGTHTFSAATQGTPEVLTIMGNLDADNTVPVVDQAAPFQTLTAGGVQTFGCPDGDSAQFVKIELQDNATYIEFEYISGVDPVNIALVSMVDPLPAGCPDLADYQEVVFEDVDLNPMEVCDLDGAGPTGFWLCGTNFSTSSLYLWIGAAEGDVGPFEIQMTQHVGPDNDECDVATNVQFPRTLAENDMNCLSAQTNEYACPNPLTSTTSCVNSNDDDAAVFFRFNSGEIEEIESIEFTPSGVDFDFVILEENGCTEPLPPTIDNCETQVNGTSSVMPKLKRNTDYIIVVSTERDDMTDDFEVCINTCDVPNNDIVCNAEVIDLSGTGNGMVNTGTFTTACATPFFVDDILTAQDFGCTDFNNGVFFEITLDPDATYLTFEANTGSAGDLAAQLFALTSCDNIVGGARTIPTPTVFEAFLLSDGSTITTGNVCDFDSEAFGVSLCGIDKMAQGTFYLWVASTDGNEGDFDIEIEQFVAPTNDECENATDMGNLTYNNSLCVNSTNLGACPVITPCFDDGAAVWFTFNSGEVEEIDNITINSLSGLGDVFDFVIAEATAVPNCSNLNAAGLPCLNGVSELLEETYLKRNTDYYIVVKTNREDWGDFELCLNTCDPPPNDKPCGNTPALVPIRGGAMSPVSYSGTTECATPFFGNDNLGVYPADPCNLAQFQNVVYFPLNNSASASELIFSNFTYTGNDMLGMAFFTFDPGCDDGPPRDHGAVRFVTGIEPANGFICDVEREGEVRVDLCEVDLSTFPQPLYLAFFTTDEGAGDFSFDFQEIVRPSNDSCMNAEEFTLDANTSSVCFNRTTIGACPNEMMLINTVGPTNGDMTCDGVRNPNRAHVWYKFTVPNDNNIYVLDGVELSNEDMTTMGFGLFESDGPDCSQIDTLLQCLEGDDIDENNGNNDAMNAILQNGRTYYISLSSEIDEKAAYDFCLTFRVVTCNSQAVGLEFFGQAPLLDVNGDCETLDDKLNEACIYNVDYRPNSESISWNELGAGCSAELHDPNWYVFGAGEGDLSLLLDVIACEDESPGCTGIQFALYELPCDVNYGDPSFNTPLREFTDDMRAIPVDGVECGGTCFTGTTQIDISEDDIDAGKIYGILIDGCCGARCITKVSVLDGSDPPPPPGVVSPMFEESGFGFENDGQGGELDTICFGAVDVEFFVPDLSGPEAACGTQWTLDGIVLTDQDDDPWNRFVTFDGSEPRLSPGVHEICVQATNSCGVSEDSCRLFVVQQLPVIEIDSFICEGDDMDLIGTLTGTIFESITQAEPAPENPIIRQYFDENLYQCEQEHNWEIEVYDEMKGPPHTYIVTDCNVGDLANENVYIEGYLSAGDPEYIVPTNPDLPDAIPDGAVEFFGEGLGYRACDTMMDIRIYQLGWPVLIRSQCAPDTSGKMSFVAQVNTQALNSPTFQGAYTNRNIQINEVFNNVADYDYDGDGRSDYQFKYVWSINGVDMSAYCISDVCSNVEIPQAVIENIAGNDDNVDIEVSLEITTPDIIRVDNATANDVTGTEVCTGTPAILPFSLPNNFPEVTFFDGDQSFCPGADSIEVVAFSRDPLNPDVDIFGAPDSLPDSIAENYTWILPNGFNPAPGFTLMDNPLIIEAPDGASGDIEICFVATTSRCGFVDTLCQVLDNEIPPVPIIQDFATCGRAFTLDYDTASIRNGNWSVISVPSFGDRLNIDNRGSINTEFSSDTSGLYQLEWTQGGSQCARRDTVTIEFYDNPVIETDFDCEFGVEWTGTYTINGGNAPYTVDVLGTTDEIEGGTLSGNLFTTPTITIDFDPTTGNLGDTMQLVIVDDLGCRDTAILRLVCVCVTEAGDMDRDTVELCEGEGFTFNYDPTNELNDGNDSTMFIIHTRADSSLGRVIDTSLDGTFTFKGDRIDFGRVYYVSNVIGNGFNGFVNLQDPCLAVPPGQPVIWYDNPDPEAGATDTTCGLEYTLMATQDAGVGTWTASPSAGVVFTDANRDTTTVTVPSNGGDYTFTWTVDNNGCVQADSVDITLLGDILPLTIDSCDGTSTLVDFTIVLSGGGFEYAVVDSANLGSSQEWLNDSTYKVYQIPKDVGDTVVFNSDFGCGPLEVVLFSTCECQTEVGDFTRLDNYQLCEDEVLDITVLPFDTMADSLDANDALSYVLLDIMNADTPIDLTTVIDQQSSGMFTFDPTTMTFGQIYYVYRVAGNRVAGGNVDLSNECTVISENSAQVIWRQNPVANAGTDSTFCFFDGSLSGARSINGSSIEWTYIGDSSGVSIVDNSLLATGVSVTNYGTYAFELAETNANLCTDRDTVLLTFVSAPEIDNIDDQICDNIAENYRVTFDIVLGEESSLQVEGNYGGNLSGRTYTSDWIPNDSTYTFRVFDANGCDTAEISGSYRCPCITVVGDLATTPVDLCFDVPLSVPDISYDDSGEVLDGNDRRMYVLVDGAGNVIDSTFAEPPVFNFDSTRMNFDQTYQVLVYAGTFRSGFLYNDRCTQVSSAMDVTWYAPPEVISITADADTLTCTDTIIEISSIVITGSGSPLDFSWTTTDGNIISGASTATIEVDAPGTYNLTVTDPVSGCVVNDSYTIFKSDDIPDVSILTPDLLTCVVNEVTVDASNSTAGPTIEYSWSGPGIVGPSDGNSITVDEVGSYTLTIRDNSNGCRISGSIEVDEDRVPPTAIANTDGILGCIVDAVTVSGSGSSEGSEFVYEWTTNDGSISSGNSDLNATVTDVGTYTLIITNTSNGCVDSVSTIVEQNENELTAIDVDANDPLCHGETNGTIAISPLNGTLPITYDIGVNSNQNGLFSNLAPGTYNISVTDANGCTVDTMVTLIDPPILTIDIPEFLEIFNRNEDDTIITVDALLPPNAVFDTILWNTDSVPFECVDPECRSIRFAPPTTLTVIANVIGGVNCGDQDEMRIIVKVVRDVFVPNIFSPNNDGLNDVVVPMLGHRIENVDYFQIYTRWGEKVYEARDFAPDDMNFGWDGSHNGQPVMDGVYVYKVQVTYDNGTTEQVNGTVTVVR